MISRLVATMDQHSVIIAVGAGGALALAVAWRLGLVGRTSNPLAGFTVTSEELQFVGKDLQRPECILWACGALCDRVIQSDIIIIITM